IPSFINALLFAHVISVREAFLYDAFASKLKEDANFRKCIETDPEFKNEKLSVSDIYKELDSLKAKATQRIQLIVFHRLEIVQQMYKATLGIELPAGIADLLKAISKRHDIVHRKYVKLLISVDGEQYDNIDVREGKPLTVFRKSGEVVTYG